MQMVINYNYLFIIRGYTTSAVVLEVAKNYTLYDVPLDTMWNDLVN